MDSLVASQQIFETKNSEKETHQDTKKSVPIKYEKIYYSI